MSRDVAYPAFWPRYLVLGALACSILAAVHMFFVEFAAWALGLPSPAVRHAVTAPYLRLLPVYARCVGPVLSAGVGRSDPAESRTRAVCRRWWDALGWYLERRGQQYAGVAMVASVLLAGLAYSESRRRLRVPPAEARAAARWSSEEELREYSVRHNPQARPEAGAMPLGRTVGGLGPRRSMELGLPRKYRCQHVWVLGVTGAGKTSAGFKRWVVADALSEAPISNVIIDIKHPDMAGFVWSACKDLRRRIYVWAPFDPPEYTMRCNFLDYVPDYVDFGVAAALILSNTADYPRKDPFWRGMEVQLLTLLIQMVKGEPPELFTTEAIMQKARHVLRLDDDEPVPPPASLPFVLVLSHLSSDELVRLFELWPEPSRTKWQNRFATILSADDRTLVGAMLGVQQALSVFGQSGVVQSTSYSNFRLETLAYQPTTLVIGLPPQPRENRQVLTSLFIRQLLDVLGRVGESRRPTGLPVRVVLYLDEIGTLGYVGSLPDYVATYRDIGVSFVLATQDVEQLTRLFQREQAEVLLANLHTRIVFGYDLRPEQAMQISRDLGEKLILEPSMEFKGGFLSQRRSGARLLVSTRPLMTADEIRNMKPFQAAVVLPGNKRAIVHMEPVHSDPMFASLQQIQPTWWHLYRRDRELYDVLGSPPIVEPVASQPAACTASAASGARPSSGLPGAGAMPQPGIPGSVPSSPTAAGSSSADVLQAVGLPQEPIPGARSPAGDGLPSPSPGGPGTEDGPVAQTPQIDLSEGHLVAFFRSLLSGKLEDRMVANGVLGCVYTDRRGEALVPYGYFVDFGRKAGLSHVELYQRWLAEGLLGPRAVVRIGNASFSCMVFTRRASRMLPLDVQEQIVRHFARVGPDAVRVHGGEPGGRQTVGEAHHPLEARDGGEGAGRTGLQGEGSGASGGGDSVEALESLPFLRELLRTILENAGRFEGHPSFSPDLGEPWGRWRYVTRGEEELLLVRQDLVLRLIQQAGGRPRDVLASWRDAMVLRARSADRFGFRLGGTGPGFLALYWPVLRRMGFPWSDGDSRSG